MVQRDILREEFSQRLAQACRDAGLDEHGRGMAVARALGVTSKAVSKWLNAESMPRQDKMNELAKFLRVDVLWLQHNRDGTNTLSPPLDGTDKDLYEGASGGGVKLTRQQEELLRVFNTLPKAEADRFLAEMKTRSAHFMAMYEEMHKKLHGKAS